MANLPREPDRPARSDRHHVVNRVPLEAYLRGVVSAEMGRRSPPEQEALRAQAVVANVRAAHAAAGGGRLRCLLERGRSGLRRPRFQTPEGNEAVASTSGQILTFNVARRSTHSSIPRVVDAPRMGTEVFRAANRPYLRSVPDLDPNRHDRIAASRRGSDGTRNGAGKRCAIRYAGPFRRSLALRPARSTTCRDLRVTATRGRDGWDDSVLR